MHLYSLELLLSPPVHDLMCERVINRWILKTSKCQQNADHHESINPIVKILECARFFSFCFHCTLSFRPHIGLSLRMEKFKLRSRFDTNFTIYRQTSTLQTLSYHNHYLYQVLMVAVTNKIVMVIVIRNASTFTRELKWSTSLIIVTFWTAWQHIFPPSTTRLCSLYSSGGSHK